MAISLSLLRSKYKSYLVKMELLHVIFLLRAAQVVCAFLGMALTARVIDVYNRHGPGSNSAFNFSLFTCITGLCLSSLVIGAPFLYNRLRWTWTRFLVDPFGETMSSLVYIVFFFISGTVVAIKAAPGDGGCSAQHFMDLWSDDVSSDDSAPGACRAAKSAAAFDFLALATWIGTFALLVYMNCYRLRVLFVPGAAAAHADVLSQNATMASMSPSSNLPPALPSQSTNHSASTKPEIELNSGASNAVSDSNMSISTTPQIYASNIPSQSNHQLSPSSSSSPSLPLNGEPVVTAHSYAVSPSHVTNSSLGSPSLSMPEPVSTGQSSPILLATNPPSPNFPSPHLAQHRRQFSGECRSITTTAPSMVASYDPSAYTGRTALTTYTRTVTPPTTLQDDRSVYPASTDAIYHGSSRATDSILSREALSIPSIRSREEENEMGSLYPASTDGMYQGSSRAPSLPDDVKEE
ncbi:hypothetical protein BDF22DRAFT_673093 [Syncephalis plumigaleata]|nr:hypothetical protein BDF22DRAFT_673093 [Syncephalis plumigaleata]